MLASHLLRSRFLPVLAALFTAAPAFAGQREITPTSDGAPAEPSDLTLGNFFGEGWNQGWVHRADPDATPDMALLKVQTNFLEREFRFDFYSERNVNSPSKNNIDYLDALVAYSFNVVSCWRSWAITNGTSTASEPGTIAMVARRQRWRGCNWSIYRAPPTR